MKTAGTRSFSSLRKRVSERAPSDSQFIVELSFLPKAPEGRCHVRLLEQYSQPAVP
jgi:hypothetical protein